MLVSAVAEVESVEDDVGPSSPGVGVLQFDVQRSLFTRHERIVVIVVEGRNDEVAGLSANGFDADHEGRRL